MNLPIKPGMYVYDASDYDLLHEDDVGEVEVLRAWNHGFVSAGTLDDFAGQAVYSSNEATRNDYLNQLGGGVWTASFTVLDGQVVLVTPPPSLADAIYSSPSFELPAFLKKKAAPKPTDMSFVTSPDVLRSKMKERWPSQVPAVANLMIHDYDSLYRYAQEKAEYAERAVSRVLEWEARCHGVTEDLEKLRSTHFDIKTFTKFSKNLYKVLDVQGPDILKAEDLPKFLDFVYAEIKKANYMEPELP